MFPPTKKAMAAALACAAIASSLGPYAAPAAPGSDACVPPPPSLIAASAEQEYTQLRAACASLASTRPPVTDESNVSG